MRRLPGGRRSPEDSIEARLRRTRGALGGDRFSRLPNTIALAALARARFVLGTTTSLAVDLVEDIPFTAAGKFERAVVSGTSPTNVRDAGR